LAYRPDGQPGFNLELDASTNTHIEIGADTRVGSQTLLRASVFRIDTPGGIVAALNVAGRTTCRNAERTRRHGLDPVVASAVRPCEAVLAGTCLDARAHKDAVHEGAALVGSRPPRRPRCTGDGELAWRPAPSGFSDAMSALWDGRVHLDEASPQS